MSVEKQFFFSVSIKRYRYPKIQYEMHM